MPIFAIPFPNISPEIFTIDLWGMSFSLRWYALAYIVGILIGMYIIRRALARAQFWEPYRPALTYDQIEPLSIWMVIGVLGGGRLGHTLIYQADYYLANPIEILHIWKGGMAFHGGLLGVGLGILLFSALNRVRVLSVMDLIALAAPTGLFLGRIANFINAELWGRPTELAWGVIFPGAMAQDCPGVVGLCARHPSQLYEATLEGLVLGIVLFVLFYRRWIAYPGALSGAFLVGYAIARFIVEFVRNPDPEYIYPYTSTGFVVQISDYGITMGQALSIPMLILGVFLIYTAFRRK